MERKYRVVFLIVGLLVGLAIGFGVGRMGVTTELSLIGPFYLPKEAVVTKVYDGDTIQVRSVYAKAPLVANTVLTRDVRYLGIDTPDQGEAGYREAKEANERLVAGKRITLKYEGRQDDKYGRILAKVYVDGKSVEEGLLRMGYGK